MNVPPDAVGVEVASEGIAIVDMHHKLMEDVAGSHLREPHGRVVDLAAINRGEFAPQAVFFVDVSQFIFDNRSLHRVEAAIETFVDVVVTAVAAIICKGPDSNGQTGVVGHHGPGITDSADILRGIEADSGCIAKRACHIVAVKSRGL